MSEWDKLNRYEKARITRNILYGGWQPGGSVSEKTRKRQSDVHKKRWADLPPEEKERRAEIIANEGRKYRANESPKEREARIRAISKGLRKSKKFKEATKNQRTRGAGSEGLKEYWASLPPEERRERRRRSKEKAVETRRRLYGPSGVRDPEAWRRAISEGLENRSSEEKEAHGRAISEGQAKLPPEKRKAWGRAISEGLRNSEKFKEAMKTRGGTWADHSPEQKEAHCGAISKGLKKYWANRSLKEREAHGRATSEGLKRSRDRRREEEEHGQGED